MKKIILMCGVSGSGKSTLAKQIFEKDPKNSIIVGRDKIRELLFGYTESNISEYYLREDLRALEKEVSRYQDTLIYDSLERNKTVIVDNTNLDCKYLESFKYWNVPIEFIYTEDSFDLKLCIMRDGCRERSVGKEVIKRQYNKFIALDKDIFKNYVPKKINNDNREKYCIVVDIDGTIAEKNDRNPFDWSRVGEDSTIDSIAHIVHQINKDPNIEVIFVTGRDEICREQTRTWLDERGFTNCSLLHRNNKDCRADWIIKEEIWDTLNSMGYRIVSMFDDRLQVVRRARALGYKVLNVEYNNF